jgi:hypothetical protein
MLYRQAGGANKKQCYSIPLFINHVVQALRCPAEKQFMKFPYCKLCCAGGVRSPAGKHFLEFLYCKLCCTGGVRCPMRKHFLEFPAGETLQEARRRILPEFSHRAAHPTSTRERICADSSICFLPHAACLTAQR